MVEPQEQDLRAVLLRLGDGGERGERFAVHAQLGIAACRAQLPFKSHRLCEKQKSRRNIRAPSEPRAIWRRSALLRWQASTGVSPIRRAAARINTVYFPPARRSSYRPPPPATFRGETSTRRILGNPNTLRPRPVHSRALAPPARSRRRFPSNICKRKMRYRNGGCASIRDRVPRRAQHPGQNRSRAVGDI